VFIAFFIASLIVLGWAMLTIVGAEKKRLDYAKLVADHEAQQAEKPG